MHAVTGFPAVTPEQFATRRQAGSTRTKRSHVYPRSPCNRADILSTSRHMPVLVGVVD
jgi:hypothetical protein